VEFDLESLKPTYHLTIGLPGRSNALAIANRLGLPKSITEEARADIDPADLRAENLLEEIHRQRDLAHQARTEAEAARQEVDQLRVELAEKLEKIEDERREILDLARKEAEDQLRDVDEQLKALRRGAHRETASGSG
jgi:DNA mismatch repair protein MutS2